MEGRSGQRFRGKLKLLRANLRSWNKNTFGVLEERKSSLLNEIEWWDKREEELGLSREDISCRDAAREELKRVFYLEEIKWKQKSKAH